MNARRTVPVVFAAVLLVTFALPAAGQLVECNATPPAGPRAGFTCDPLQGGGQYTETTCTFYGDIAWMIANSEGEIPTNACGVTLTYANADWTTTPGYEQVDGNYIAGYCFSDEPTEILWQYCNVPVTSGAGLVLFVIALAAFGGFILWRRAA